MLDPQRSGSGRCIDQQNQIGITQSIVDLLLDWTAGQDLRFAIEFFGFIEKWTMTQGREMFMELCRYGSAIRSPIRNKELTVTSLQAKTKHSSHSVNQPTVWARSGSV